MHTQYIHIYIYILGRVEIAQLVTALVDDPGVRGTNPVTAITFSYVAIHFQAVYNLHHEKAVHLIPYHVGG